MILVVSGNVSNELQTGDREAAKISCYFLTTSSGHGMAYAQTEHTNMMEACGFRSAESRLTGLGHGVIVGTK